MASYPVSEDIYRKLISLLEERNDFVGISQLLEDCNDEVKNTFQKYLASPPEFSMTEGTYYEIVPLKLLSSTTGDIYYTLDGKKPDLTSSLYTSPIFLDAGKYTVSAIFVNDYGVISDSVTRQYYIDVTKPVGPEINLYSGDYDLPEMIMASSLNEEETIYYTLDGTEPSIDSFRYFGPIPMPLGESTFKFITCTEDGVYSDIIERVYRLNIKYHISP